MVDRTEWRIVRIEARASLNHLRNRNYIVFVDTYDIPDLLTSSPRFIGISLDGRTAWNAARKVDRIQKIYTDPGSPRFGTIAVSRVLEMQQRQEQRGTKGV